MSNAPRTFKNLLLLSGGSKVAIARIAKKATQSRGATLHISDTRAQVPTREIADEFTLLPTHTAHDWSSALKELCQKASIGLVIPTRHTELLALQDLKPELESQGTAVSLSGENTLKTCIHKLDTHEFFQKNQIPSPTTFTKTTLPPEIRYPLIAKPQAGASSAGISEIQNADELANVPSDWILQSKASGIEFTVNLYLDKNGKPLCIIPHERIAVESGEVVQARTRRIPKLIEICKSIAQALPDASGIINIQAFYDQNANTVSVIEINPRIGGGYPLCDAAKGHYIEWLCQEHLDHKAPQSFQAWTENLLMMRYREALFSL
ncbi:ATP-grasp domain-containing protein [Pelagicoccus mobilis]|uniref:ATP-grasp domain-containing protein n=1 Tax=Pelagicoccus mobilis TaxID=415221 RepID=A0A934VN12_9BACT|nr:ATP-grasp domain-containing protein [Pelagicoccus mobilis]MBK1875752.1 ATP-grasp domain-containing protein [Pelagicoccus mobilis]